jgi:hypothetical protein
MRHFPLIAIACDEWPHQLEPSVAFLGSTIWLRRTIVFPDCCSGRGCALSVSGLMIGNTCFITWVESAEVNR